MALVEGHANSGDSANGHSATGEASVSSAIEHLVAGSQGVLAKRIDLALLEGQDLISHALQRAAIAAFGMVLAAGAWFAAAACLVLLLIPNANPVLRLAAFAILNAGAALGLVALAMRGRTRTAARQTGNASGTTAAP